MATAFPVPEHRVEVIAAVEAAIARVHDEPGVELYALHEGRDRLVMIEKYESEEALSEHNKGRGARRPAVRFGGQAQQGPRPAGPGTAPGRKRAEGHALTARLGRPLIGGRRGGFEPGLSDRDSRHPSKPRHQRPGEGETVAGRCDASSEATVTSIARSRRYLGWQAARAIDPYLPITLRQPLGAAS